MDIALTFQTGKPYADIELDGPDLKVNKDLESSTTISVFANRLAESGDEIEGDDRQGWWGDTFAQISGSLIGSRLWELKRTKQIQSIVNLARQYCLEALQWLVDDMVAASVEVEAEIVAMYTLGIGVRITKPTGGFQNFQYTYVWSQV